MLPRIGRAASGRRPNAPRRCGRQWTDRPGCPAGGEVHFGRRADQFDAVLIGLADFFNAGKSVHAEVPALSGEIELGGVGGGDLGHGNSRAEAAN